MPIVAESYARTEVVFAQADGQIERAGTVAATRVFVRHLLIVAESADAIATVSSRRRPPRPARAGSVRAHAVRRAKRIAPRHADAGRPLARAVHGRRGHPRRRRDRWNARLI